MSFICKFIQPIISVCVWDASVLRGYFVCLFVCLFIITLCFINSIFNLKYKHDFICLCLMSFFMSVSSTKPVILFWWRSAVAWFRSVSLCGLLFSHWIKMYYHEEIIVLPQSIPIWGWGDDEGLDEKWEEKEMMRWGVMGCGEWGVGRDWERGEGDVGGGRRDVVGGWLRGEW